MLTMIIIASVAVLYGCETHITLSGSNRNWPCSVLRKMYGPDRNHVIGKWRRIHNEEFYDLY